MKARRMDRGSQFAVIASQQAVSESRYPVAENREQIGIALGTGSAGSGALQEFMRILLTESPEAAPPFHFPNTIANAPASQVSLELQFHGPNATITQKDPSALNAAIYAVACVESGRAQAMIAGGVDEWNYIYGYAMDQMRALRGRKNASGIVQGEGAYVVLIEEEQRARARGARPLARLSGFSFASSPSAPYEYAPDERAAEHAIRGALEASGAAAGDIGLILVNRNGRREIDEMEERLLARFFGNSVERFAVKDSIGEMAAAGGAQMVVAAKRLERPEGPARALINSFGAGGNFISLVLEKA